MEEDLRKVGVNQEEAQDRIRWRDIVEAEKKKKYIYI